jgi:hypothetical protein
VLCSTVCQQALHTAASGTAAAARARQHALNVADQAYVNLALPETSGATCGPGGCVGNGWPLLSIHCRTS